MPETDSPRDPKSKRIFEFLKDAYVKDDKVLRLPLDRCGWRSLVQIGEGTGSAPNTLYGKKPGHLSPVLQGLITVGLIEMRYFGHERGRGGEVMRFRISDPKAMKQRTKQSLADQSSVEEAPKCPKPEKYRVGMNRSNKGVVILPR